MVEPVRRCDRGEFEGGQRLGHRTRFSARNDMMVVIESGIDTNRFRFDATERERVRNEWKVGAGVTAMG